MPLVPDRDGPAGTKPGKWVQSEKRAALASMIENLLEFGSGFCAASKFQVGLTAQILRPELGCCLISGSLQCLYSERWVATFDFFRSLYYGQPLAVNEAIF